MLTQRARDVKAGLNTAGYVTGYRGSPIASLEAAMLRAKGILEPNHIKFMAGLNEDLAATALWGSQQAELRGEGKYDGVFGVWYGKGPGVDRTGDVFRHANHAGTSKHGGVLALMGDDHTCESSTSAHQSEFAFVDYMMPVLNPAGVQEILDYGVLGFALSRFAGVWVGIKCVKDNIEATATVDGRIDRVAGQDPRRFRRCRRTASTSASATRRWPRKRACTTTSARPSWPSPAPTSSTASSPAAGRSRRSASSPAARAISTCAQAMDELGIDEVKANQLGIRLYKVGMTWPLEPQGVRKFAEGLDLILVIEEKRSLIETQVKEQLYDLPDRPRVLGKKDENEQWLFPAKYALDPTDIAIKIGERLIRNGAGDDIKARVAELKRLKGNQPTTAEAATRIPYFCPGCPHNSSTVVPEGSRAYAGIGCHYMAHWMDRNDRRASPRWAARAPTGSARRRSPRRTHVFQNLGDGTYIHSGSLAIRAARRGRRQHDLQDPLQRRRGHDRRPVARRRHDRVDDRSAGAGRGRREGRRRHRRAATSIRRASSRRACPSTTAATCRAVQKELREVPGVSVLRLRPDLRGREAAPAQARHCSPIPTSACSSIRPCARAAATAA